MLDPNIAKAMEAIADMANDPDIQEMVRVRQLANINWRHSHAVAQEAGARTKALEYIEKFAIAFNVLMDDARRRALAVVPIEQLEALFDSLFASQKWPSEYAER